MFTTQQRNTVYRVATAGALGLTLLMSSACGASSGPEADVVVVLSNSASDSAPTDPTTTPASTTGQTSTGPGGTDGQLTGESGPTTDLLGAVVGPEYPVEVSYAGVVWSLTGLTREMDDDDLVWVAALQLRNETDLGMQWPIDVLSLRTEDGADVKPDRAVGTGSRKVKVDSRATTNVDIQFMLAPDTDAAGMSMAVAETGRIPAVTPFTGRAPVDAYPIDAGFTGTTKPLPLQRRTAPGGTVLDEDDVVTVSAVTARIDLDAPVQRARTGGRLAVLDVTMTASTTNDSSVNIDEDNFRLEVDGSPQAPVALLPGVPDPVGFYPQVEVGATAPVTLIFEIPTAAEDLALVVTAPEGYSSDRIPVVIGTLPPCCGE